MDQNARLLRLWEHACCGDRYWSAGERCDKCGAAAFGFVTRISLADAMARMHFHAPRPIPTTVPAPAAAAPSGGATARVSETPPLPGSAALRGRPSPRRPPIREEEAEAPATQPAVDPVPAAWVDYAVGLVVAGALLLLVTHMLLSV